MSHDAYARAQNFHQREISAQYLRRAFGCVGAEPLPAISAAIANFGLIPLVRSMDAMGDVKACAYPAGGDVHIREDVMPGIMDDTHDARWLLCHEIAHASFHDNGNRYFKVSTGNVLFPFLTEDNSAEQQADLIADAVMMPVEMVQSFETPTKLAAHARAPIERAVVRFRAIFVLGANKTSSATQLSVARLRLLAGGTPAERKNTEAAERKLRLWNALPAIPGEEPLECRNCGGFRIVWNEFGKTTQCGWFIEGERIVSHFATRGS